MEMEMEANEDLASVDDRNVMAVVTARLAETAGLLEQVSARLAGLELEAAAGTREHELEARLAEAEATIEQLKGTGRKTFAAAAQSRGTLVAKEAAAVEPGALDAALGCLSIEQRIAVKAGLLRGGLLR